MGLKMKKDIVLLSKELKKTKEELADLQRYFEELFYFLPLSVCALNPLGIIISINKSLEVLSHYTSLEIVGEPVEILFLEKEKFKKEFLKEIIEKETIYRRKLILISKEKKEIPVSVSGSVRKDEKGNFLGYFLAITDITEIEEFQKELEKKIKLRTEELEQSKIALLNILEDIEEARRKAEEEKEKTLTIITNFADGLLVFDKENNLDLINLQAEKFLNVKENDVIGKSIQELTIFPFFESLIVLIGEEMKEIFRKELFIKDKLTLEISVIPIIRKGERVNTLVILHDITREKMIERMKTEFVSLAAHQLRTPLSAIKWTLRMLLDGDLGSITTEQKEFIEKTYNSNEKMIVLINDLLDVTRIEEGRFLYKPILVDIESLVQSVINSYKDEIERKKIKFEFKKPEEKLPEVKIDVEKVRFVIENLFDNSIRYTYAGGTVTIFLKYNKENKEIEFSIRDTGMGIPKDQQKRIFTKFFRGANIIKVDTEGTGLGLFIAKNIIESHGGRIWFESEEGKGTIFYFTLPVKM